MSGYNSKTSSVTPVFLSLNYDKHEKMQLFAKFKKTSVEWVWSHLKFLYIEIFYLPFLQNKIFDCVKEPCLNIYLNITC